MADGWFHQVQPGPELDSATAIIAEAAAAAGRDPSALGMEGRVKWTDAGVGKLVDDVGRWDDAGATHVAINTMNAGFESVTHHLDALGLAADALALSP